MYNAKNLMSPATSKGVNTTQFEIRCHHQYSSWKGRYPWIHHEFYLESLGKSVQNILCTHVRSQLNNGFISKIFSCKSDFTLTSRPGSTAKNQSTLFMKQLQFKLRYLLLKPLPVQPLQWERDELV